MFILLCIISFPLTYWSPRSAAVTTALGNTIGFYERLTLVYRMYLTSETDNFRPVFHLERIHEEVDGVVVV